MRQLKLFKVAQTGKERQIEALDFEAAKNLARQAKKTGMTFAIYKGNINNNKIISEIKALIFYRKAYLIISKLCN